MRSRRVIGGIIIVAAVVGVIFFVGYLADPTWPWTWTGRSLLRYLGLGRVVVVAELVVEAIRARCRGRSE